MCGIIGLLVHDRKSHVNQLLFDGLTVLQHRGQDAAGMVTADETTGKLHLHKGIGLVKDVFTQDTMEQCTGRVGIGHNRYPTAGDSHASSEAQPLYTNFPYGLCIAHNGNLTNATELRQKAFDEYRHMNTDSDSELLLHVFAEELRRRRRKNLDPMDIFECAGAVMRQCKGAFAVVILINGQGILGFRDAFGIRPVCVGRRQSHIDSEVYDYVIASESVVCDTIGFELMGDIQPGECVFIDMDNVMHRSPCYRLQALPTPSYVDSYLLTHHDDEQPSTSTGASSPCTSESSKGLHRTNSATESIGNGGRSSVINPLTISMKPRPCIFEYVYFSRPDSILDGVSVYEARLNMGQKLAEKIKRVHPDHDIDVIIPIPDTSRTSALQCAYALNRPFREGFIRNRYIARTFIMPGQAVRRKSVKLKMNTIKSEFRNKNVCLVDDSIVRGTTCHELVQMARDAGAKKVYMVSAAPPIRYPNVYGIDIPTRSELIANQRDEEEIAKIVGADWVIYQDLEDLKESIHLANEELLDFDASCFDGRYITGDITEQYLASVHEARNDKVQSSKSSRGAKSPVSAVTDTQSGQSKLWAWDSPSSPSQSPVQLTIQTNEETTCDGSSTTS